MLKIDFPKGKFTEGELEATIIKLFKAEDYTHKH